MKRSSLIAATGCAAAICLATGWYVHLRQKESLGEAAQKCRIRAQQGDAAAEADLAFMYAHGQGVAQNYAEAFRWRLEAAEQGNAKAEDGLAFMYTHGQGVQKDYKEALFWRRKAANQGDAKAQYDLGLMYYSGEGVPPNYAEAIQWYRKSASQGYASGQYGLGFMYYYGYGVPQDRGEADQWFQKAADQGDPDAKRSLGIGITLWRGLALLTEIVGGLLLILGFLAARNRRGPRRRIWLGTGILCFFTAGISWYGYTHQVIWSLFGIRTFPLVKWALDLVLVLLLFSILRSRDRSFGQI